MSASVLLLVPSLLAESACFVTASAAELSMSDVSAGITVPTESDDADVGGIVTEGALVTGAGLGVDEPDSEEDVCSVCAVGSSVVDEPVVADAGVLVTGAGLGVFSSSDDDAEVAADVDSEDGVLAGASVPESAV